MRSFQNIEVYWKTCQEEDTTLAWSPATLALVAGGNLSLLLKVPQTMSDLEQSF